MKIRLGTLRKLIREVSLQPGLFPSQTTDDPLKVANLSKAVDEVEKQYKNAVAKALLFQVKDKYNQDTRELEDAVWERVEQAAKSTTEELKTQISKLIRDAWSRAHGSIKPQ